MKVVLLKNIPKLGQAGQLKNVSDGYARNFLLPSKLVVPATAANIKKAEKIKEMTQVTEANKAEAQKSALGHIKGLGVRIKAKATPEGKLFAGINAQRIVDEISQSVEFYFRVESVVMDKPIKQVGEHKVDIKVGEEKETVRLNIINEDEK